MKKRRRLKKKVKRILLLAALMIATLVFFIVLISTFNSMSKKGSRYKNEACVFYYPNNQHIKEYGIELCKNGEDKKYEYEITEYQNYNVVSYETGKKFYLDKKNKDLKINLTDRYDILTNALRYQMKKDNIDIAYTSDFINETNEENIKNKKINLSVIGDQINIYFNDYDYNLLIPIEEGQELIDLDLANKKTYEFKYYVNPNRKMIAITYDDGPFIKIEEEIYRIMKEYDARCTFYYVGNRISEEHMKHIADGAKLGLEYGSHSYDHTDLATLSVNDAKENVMRTVNEVYAGSGYQMKTYRPPYGSRNWDLEPVIGLDTVLWNIDSLDWNNRDSDLIYNQVMNNLKDKGIILMHSLYDSSLEATRRIVPALIDQGYQIVTVSELLANR